MNEVREQFNRVRRWQEKIGDIFQVDHDSLSRPENDDENRDIIYSFFQNCYHLKDWVINCSQIKKSAVDSFIESNTDMKICRDICNGTKHFKIKSPSIDPNIVSTIRGSTLSLGINDSIKFKAVYLVNVENTPVDIFGLADNCVELWRAFLILNGIRHI